ncbi:MAG: energy transducer TonB [Alphaproteobacteria bacterium]|nr:energy transducer TonB [Alphaproteobacteria bacterium]
MNARKREAQEPQDHHSMKGPIIKSTVFHLAIFLVTLIGFPFIAKEPMIITPVSVELADISDITRTNKVAPPKKEPEKPKEIEAPKPPEEKLTPPKSEPKSAPEIPEPAIPEPPKEEIKKPEPKKEPPPEKKKEEPKPKPKPKPPEPKKEDPKKQENDFSSLLKNLTPDTHKTPEAESEEKPDKDAEPAPGALAELGDKLTMSELDAFKRQIEPCWNVPAGAEYAENLAVEVRVTMRRDMTVQDTSVLDKARYNRDSAFRAAADSAQRALRNPRCSPLRLPPDKYNEWKTIIINFDPREML